MAQALFDKNLNESQVSTATDTKYMTSATI